MKKKRKLKNQEDRYAKAYGAGAISVEQLKEYTQPIKERSLVLQNQIIQAELETGRTSTIILPKPNEIEMFSKKVKESLKDLKFEVKQGIVKNIVNKIIGTRTELQVYGYIPITENINVLPLHRHRRSPERRQIDTL